MLYIGYVMWIVILMDLFIAQPTWLVPFIWLAGTFFLLNSLLVTKVVVMYSK